MSRLFLLLLLIPLNTIARTYYVKNAGKGGNGLSDAAAWSYSQLATANLVRSDSVLFKRGEVFFGPLPVKSGVVYAAYGTGNDPVISGFKTISGWKQHAGNIYAAPLELSLPLNLVTLNGKVVAMGRYPNAGYLQYTVHKENTSIRGEDVAGLPFNATGAEAVIRKVRWILDRQPVITHRKNMLNLSTSTAYGGSLTYEAVDKNGFFIQNHLGTLDAEGEWYFDQVAKRLYMVLSNPAKTVRVSVVDKLVNLAGLSGVTFRNLQFEGSNTHGLSLADSRRIAVVGCRFYQHGQTAIYGANTRNVVIRSSLIQDCLNSGIWIEWDGNKTLVEDVTVRNCGTVAGAGRSGDAAQQGISIAGDGTTIRGCTVIRTGYNAIQFNGSHALVENNYIDRFCLVKDDGAGIYTYLEDGKKVRDRVVRNNTVFHAQGAYDGAAAYPWEAYGKAAGIYLDGNCHQTTVTDNQIGYGSWAGIFVHNNGNNKITRNVVYGYPVGLLLTASTAGAIRNLVVSGNNFMGEKSLQIRLMADDDPLKFGSFNQNCYQRGRTIVIERQYGKTNGTRFLRLTEWKALGMDKGSFE